MLNRTAREAFYDHLRKAVEMPRAHALGAENELGWAAGLVSYALFAGDINIEECNLLHMRIRAARASRVATLIRECRMGVS